MAHKKEWEIQSKHPNFSYTTRSLEHKNQGFVRQNFVHTKRAWIMGYKKRQPSSLLRIETVPLIAAIWTSYFLGLPRMESRYPWRLSFITPVYSNDDGDDFDRVEIPGFPQGIL